MQKALHTSDIRHFKRLWLANGGVIESVHRTGEARYIHHLMKKSVRTNDRRHDVPAKLLSAYNSVSRFQQAANDPLY
jgi:hypothetical protein